MKFKYQKFSLGPVDPTKPLIPRPYIPVYLLGSSKRTESPYFALLDSGADRVIFPAELASDVGISDFRKGRSEPTVGIANQKADVYYHTLSLQVLGDTRQIPIDVGFSQEVVIPILGRSFFRAFRAVVFDEIKEEVELRV